MFPPFSVTFGIINSRSNDVYNEDLDHIRFHDVWRTGTYRQTYIQTWDVHTLHCIRLREITLDYIRLHQITLDYIRLLDGTDATLLYRKDILALHTFMHTCICALPCMHCIHCIQCTYITYCYIPNITLYHVQLHHKPSHCIALLHYTTFHTGFLFMQTSMHMMHCMHTIDTCHTPHALNIPCMLRIPCMPCIDTVGGKGTLFEALHGVYNSRSRYLSSI